VEETSIPHDLKYTSEHEWIRITGKTAVMGITDYAQKQLGDIVFIELPDAGDEVGQNDALGVIESVKAASDFFAPVSGKIKSVNKAVVEEPAIVNKDPYGDGWLVKLTVADENEVSDLLSYEEYKGLLAEEE